MTIVYLIFLLLAGYCSWKYDGIEKHDSHKAHRYWLLCVMLICISGFSYGVGGDKFVYMEAFENLPNQIDSLLEYVYLKVLIYNHMPLWTLLMVFVKRCFNSFYVLQFIQSGIINIIFCYVVSKYTHRQFLFLFIYFLSGTFFIFNMEIMREGLAIAFCLLAVESFLNGQKSRFTFFAFLGILFHVSAAIIFCFPFCHARTSRRLLLIAFGISFVTWGLSDFILSHVASLAIGGIGMIVQKILYYSFQASTIFGFLRSAITFIILPFFVMYYNVKWETDEKLKEKKERLISFYMLLSVCACAFAGFTRIRNYAEIYMLFFFADFIYIWLKTKERFVIRTICLIGIVFLTSLKFFLYYQINKAYFYERFIPYTCILNEDKSVYIRKEIHIESTSGEATDNNTRNLE